MAEVRFTRPTGIVVCAVAGRRHETPHPRRVLYRGSMRKGPSSRLLLLAGVMFAVGLVAIVALFVTPVVTDNTAPTAVYLLTMCAPVGLALAVIFALRSGRRVR